MKYSFLLILFLFANCSDDVSTQKDCRLTQISVNGADFVTKTTYTYNASGKMDSQIRTHNGITLFNHTFSYNADGKVDKVDMVDEFSQHEYHADGKIAIIKTYSTTEELKRTITYSWTENEVEVSFTRSGLPNPYQMVTIEFLNENIMKKTVRFYTGGEPNVLQTIQVSTFEDYDENLNAFYIASLTRPGYAVDLAKNNPGKVVYHTTNYDGDGAILQESTSTDHYTYTYNSSNATASSNAVLNDASIVLDTQFHYDQCESAF